MVNKSTDINKTTQFEHEKLTTYGVGIQVLDMQKKGGGVKPVNSISTLSS
jgi:hypothetical protein